jgi:sulfur carrier protein
VPGEITVNGAAQPIPGPLALPDFLVGLGLRVGTVVVELNGVALTRGEAEAAVLTDGDVVELVRAVAGG